LARPLFLSRSHKLFYVADNGRICTIGILLLDPTIQEGFSLWRGYRNWDPTPSMHCLSTRKGPPRTSLFEDTIYWMLRSVHLTTSSLVDLERNPQTIVHPVLQLICAEWLTMNEYIKTRLGQIEWELAFPERFLVNGDVIDTALTKLHTWRRLVPLYREMLSETLERAFNFTLRSTDPNSNPISLNNENGRPCAGTSACGAAQHQHIAPSQPPHNLRPDFEQALSQMQEFQLRIDRLTSVVTAAMSIDDSRRGLQESRNVARLTWLATIFIPLSFVSSFYSMQGNIADLKDTFGWYFATAVPLSAFTLLLAWTLSTGALIGTGKRAKRRAEEASR
jgi:Mg2+ and Co2+ transporter CorA